jgi:hypothetical protein
MVCSVCNNNTNQLVTQQPTPHRTYCPITHAHTKRMHGPTIPAHTLPTPPTVQPLITHSTHPTHCPITHHALHPPTTHSTHRTHCIITHALHPPTYCPITRVLSGHPTHCLITHALSITKHTVWDLAERHILCWLCCAVLNIWCLSEQGFDLFCPLNLPVPAQLHTQPLSH